MLRHRHETATAKVAIAVDTAIAVAVVLLVRRGPSGRSAGPTGVLSREFPLALKPIAKSSTVGCTSSANRRTTSDYFAMRARVEAISGSSVRLCAT